MLTKWRCDLLGSLITIYTDHRTLENFDAQKDLSHCQAGWQEFLAHYNHHIVYIKGEDNTVADTLSHLPNTVNKIPPVPMAAMLSVATDPMLLKSIINSYETDPFCIKLTNNGKSMEGVQWKNKLLYVGNHLVIPCIRSLHEDLF